MIGSTALGALRRTVSGISVATRIASAVVVVSLLSLIVSTVIGLNTGRRLGEDLFEDQITAMRSAGNFDVTAYLNSLETTAAFLARSPQASTAVIQFSAEIAALNDTNLDDRQELIEELATTYQETFLAPLGEAGQTIDIRDLINEDNSAALYLQTTYSIGFEPLASAATIDDARDDSGWTEVHRKVHPTYRRIANQLGLSDVLLVDTDTGTIVYSVQKRPDLGANVDVGPISGSLVSTMVDRVRDDPQGGVQAVDFRRYDPALVTPVAGMAAPILDDGDNLVGAFVLLFDSSELTRTLTADEDWNEAEFPSGGDLYLTGTDGTTRSDPRGFLENPGPYLDAAQTSGQLTDDDRELINLSDTTVLALRAADETSTAAAESDERVVLRKTIEGRNAFSSVEAVAYDDITLFIVAEVDADEAQASLDDFESLLIVGVAIFMVLLAFLAVGWATSVMRPVRSLSDRLAIGAPESDDAIEVPDRSPIEFHRMAAQFEEMAQSLHFQHRQLASAREERLGLMKRMLPESVATRLAAGDQQSIDEAPDASVAVLAMVGLAAIAPAPTGDPGIDSDIQHADLEQFLSDLDDLAHHHGLERIKLIGDEYYAAVGHDRPYIDHAPRAIAFAVEAFDLLAGSPIHSGGGVELSAGVASGPITVGLTGTSGLVYDVWGVTVRRADQLARRAGHGRLFVADETTTKLPDTIAVSEFGEVTGQMAWILDLDRVGDSA